MSDERSAACCPPGGCAFRPARVRVYVMLHIIATRANEPPADLLDAAMRERAEQNSIVQCASMPGSRGRLATDIMLSLELAAKRTGLGIAVPNASALARALCPFATEDGGEH